MSTYLVSDLHGDLKKFKKLLKKIKFKTDKDKMYILGDVLDRGKDSIELLLYVKEFVEEGSMFMLKGNHELFAQMWLEKMLESIQWIEWGGEDTVAALKAMTLEEQDEIYDFIDSLPIYTFLDTEKYSRVLLTHTGAIADHIVEKADGAIDTVASIKKAVGESDFDYLVSTNLHYMPSDLLERLDYFMIVGHVPTIRLNKDHSEKILRRKYYMCIDSGSGHRKEGGKMSALRIDDDEEFYV